MNLMEIKNAFHYTNKTLLQLHGDGNMWRISIIIKLQSSAYTLYYVLSLCIMAARGYTAVHTHFKKQNLKL